MKFTVAALLASLATTCFAQGVNIGFPANGSSISPGSNITVQVVRGDTLTPSTELGIVIGLFSCTTTNSVCLPPGQALGTILLTANFDPQFPPPPSTGPPQQNFTVTIPSNFTLGLAELSVFHAALVGAENMAFAETVAIQAVVGNATT